MLVYSKLLNKNNMLDTYDAFAFPFTSYPIDPKDLYDEITLPYGSRNLSVLL